MVQSLANLTTRLKQSALLRLLLGSLGFWLLPNPAIAAERVYASYAALERSVPIASLETYAKQGKIDENLAVYAKYVSSQQLVQLRSALLARADLSAVAISQFLYTSIGERLLERLGEVIQTEKRQSGFYAIRAALILAAADPEGLTLLNIMRKFPTGAIRIDLRRSQQITMQLQQLINQTKQVSTLVSQQSEAEVASASSQVDLSRLPDLRQQGQYTWRKLTLTLNDFRRARILLTDIYLPSTSQSAPVIVISHGLGSERASFEYLATHLASYGFAVAVPQHPGSDAQQLRSLLAGLGSEVAEPNEFINRPLDVKYLLNELQRLDQSNLEFRGQMNLQQVGVIGQSFGGYTALALAGASLNFDQLQKDCQALNNSWNVSLLLQCRALELPRVQYNLQDARIKAAIAINPIDSSILGEAGLSQIQIPVMIVSSSADTFAPALPEQIIPFTWLTTPKKYLVLIQNATHFSTIGETDPATDPVVIPDEIIGPRPELARRYMDALSVAFFQTYVVGASKYRSYLSASYAKAISQTPLELSLVQSLPATQMVQANKALMPSEHSHHYVFPSARATEPETTKMAPTNAKLVRCSGATRVGIITDTAHPTASVTMGARDTIALTRDASQCSNAAAKAP